MKKIPIIVLILIVIGLVWFAVNRKPANAPTNVSLNGQNQQSSKATQPVADPSHPFIAPISDASARTTKKFFGTYVTPKNSPVQPERFTGYHTGTDFETFPNEQNADVSISVICDGKLLLKEYASGYGGVAVQACVLNGSAVTVIYGHLRLSSIAPNTGEMLHAGDHLAVLGTGYSTETDGERKHLHLGIHKGTAINILGYVQQKSQLSGWIDPLSVISISK